MTTDTLTKPAAASDDGEPERTAPVPQGFGLAPYGTSPYGAPDATKDADADENGEVTNG